MQTQPKFSVNGHDFTIENYNLARPFASFFPALAGVKGKPVWAFYANRGQAIAGFGVNDKNGAMMEFLPANKAYQATPNLGFRTFYKLSSQEDFYEPFALHSVAATQTMVVRPYEIELRDHNPDLGLLTTVVFYGLPNEALPVLVRRLTIKNVGKKSLRMELADGFPRVVPKGMDDYLVKNMSRTIEAFAEVINLENGVPFFKLKIQPDDKPDIHWLTSGFFSFAIAEGPLLPVIIDPSLLFGEDTTFAKPCPASWKKTPPLKNQLASSIMPSSFFTSSLTLAPSESKSITSYYGHGENVAHVNRFVSVVKSFPHYFEAKREEMKGIYTELVGKFGLRTGSSVLNTYADVTFMDNILRGGFPMALGPAGTFVHVFSRKHGDMERDYNNFQISATYYSQGNGNFRDVNQNRRHDLLLNSKLGTQNIDFFFNLLQLDGFNPLIIDPVRFVVPNDLLHRLELNITEESKKEFEALKRDAVLAGQLYEFVKKYSPDPLNVDALFKEMIESCEVQEQVRHGEGYWIDHWTYNLDHLDQYLSVFPDKKSWLLFEKKDFSFYDSDHYVRPRRDKYVVKEGGLRQYSAVRQDQQKKTLLHSRKKEPYKVRLQNGHGAVLEVSLFVKLMALAVVKASSLDPYGVGIEMEADKPGWCDALNGVPGIFGSSSHEMFELMRLVRFLKNEALLVAPTKTVELPQEIYSFMRDVEAAFKANHGDDFRPAWNKLTMAREEFRDKTFFGVNGKTRAVRFADVKNFLDTVMAALVRAERKVTDPDTKLPTSYFIYEVGASKLGEGWRGALEKLPWKQRRVAPFLEGVVHMMKISEIGRSSKLYQKVRKSDLYDAKLGMYRLNSPLDAAQHELGRIVVFSPGWLENESIFLHMHYKYLLEILRSGMVETFLKEIKTGFVPFRDPRSYGRPIFENSSFLASSAFSKTDVHGKGFVARLSGATSEFMSMIYFMAFGKSFFRVAETQVVFSPTPSLPASWFIREESDLGLKDSFQLSLFGVPVIYLNPKKRDTFGSRGVKPVEFEWILDGRFHVHKGRVLPPEASQHLRDGRLENLKIVLG